MALKKNKAKEILEHGMVHGKKLSEAQRRLMGAIASGQKRKKKKYA